MTIAPDKDIFDNCLDSTLSSERFEKLVHSEFFHLFNKFLKAFFTGTTRNNSVVDHFESFCKVKV